MKLNEKGIALICEFAGCRTEDILAVSYPADSGLTVTCDQAQEILTRDLEILCTGVKAAITATLNENQFSALVSFAYNVGLDNFRASSVLNSVNTNDFHQVPAELALWVKARDRVLPGLIRRRAAEAALFLSGNGAISFSTSHIKSISAAQSTPWDPCAAQAGRGIEPLLEKTFQFSRIELAAVLSAAGGLLSSAAHHLENWLGRQASLALEVAAVAVVVFAAIWIIHQHRRNTALQH
jgi:lysozyme